VLQAQRNEHGIHLRIAHPSSPCDGALPAEPTLEEALMTRRYAVQEELEGQVA
jgi:ABC-2 type transport system ATP-binding protein